MCRTILVDVWLGAGGGGDDNVLLRLPLTFF